MLFVCFALAVRSGRAKTSIGDVAPIVRKDDEDERELVNLNCGFLLLQKGLAPRGVTNVRDDKISDRKVWRPSFEQRRCLVPASAYCEPKGAKPAVWHWLAVNGEEERPLFPSRACGPATTPH
jgi:putative SOS response-associated peptidase YedK